MLRSILLCVLAALLMAIRPSLLYAGPGPNVFVDRPKPDIAAAPSVNREAPRVVRDNPDGRTGTVWLEPTYAGRIAARHVELHSVARSLAGLSVGVVASPRSTLIVGWSGAFYGETGYGKAHFLSLSARFYLHK
jgi:hypothetical protein